MTNLLIEPLELSGVEDNGTWGWTLQLHTEAGQSVTIKRIPELGGIDFKTHYRLILEELPPRSEAASAD